jgi:hypothetical protein
MRRLPLDIELDVTMRRQPNETTCGPTCLHAIYDYYQDAIALEQVIPEIQMIDNGGTYASFLGCHALRRGYAATLYTWDLMVFDPSWFAPTNASGWRRARPANSSNSAGRSDSEISRRHSCEVSCGAACQCSPD